MQVQKLMRITLLLAIACFPAASFGDGLVDSVGHANKHPNTIDSKPPKAKDDCACPAKPSGLKNKPPITIPTTVNIENKLPDELAVKLKSERDWLPFLLPLVTIVIVLSGTFVTLRQIRIRSEETMGGFVKSLDSQRVISEKSQESQRQISRSETLSKLRQAWIDSLRAELAEFVTLCAEVDSLYKDAMASGKPWPGNSWALVHSVEKSRTLIRLRLNPNEPVHDNLLNAMEDIRNASSPNAWAARYDTFVSQAQVVLKIEWNRVKLGE